MSDRSQWDREYKMRNAAAIKLQRAAYRAKKRDELNADARSYYEANKGRAVERALKNQAENPERARATQRKYSRALALRDPQRVQSYKRKSNALPTALTSKRAWKIANPAAVRALDALRRARKLHATPAWANKFFMEEAYALARLRTEVTGFPWEVDHTIPLQGKNVCGLHVENNLQVIPAIENRRKGRQVFHG